MISKFEQIQKIYDSGIIAIVRAEAIDDALKISEAIYRGGINVIEVAFTVPGAVQVIEELRKAYSHEELLLGAGTVLDPETARIAMLAGAEYLVSPCLNSDVSKLCNRYQKIYIPGCMTIGEMVSAAELGSELIKLFPGSAYAPSFIKDVKGPLPQVQLVPTGGVSIDNVHKWIKYGAFAVGIGGQLTKGAKTGNYQEVTDTAKAFLNRIQEARQAS